MNWALQQDFDIRFEWGLEGAKRLSGSVDVAIVVDVLSFSTCVEVGVSKGAVIFPYVYKDERAEAFAAEHSATLASPSRHKDRLCLSPSTFSKVSEGDRIVLPSPNGATISFSLQGVTVLCGSLRNARAVAETAMTMGRRILVIAAGEKWEAESLRPCLEDQIGAGAILSYLKGRGSPESLGAVAVFHEFRESLLPTLLACSSGQELAQRGFPEDVELAAELNVSQTVPQLRDGAFGQLYRNPHDRI